MNTKKTRSVRARNPGGLAVRPSRDISWTGPAFYVLALHRGQPAGLGHVLERIWAAAHWIATPADHPTPACGLSAVARFSDRAEAEEFARQLRIRLLAAGS